MTDKKPEKMPDPQENPAPETETVPEPKTKKIEFEVPEGIVRGVLLYEVEGHQVPRTAGYGDITMGQIYRLFNEATQGINIRMTADAVVDRLLGSMMPPPQMAEGDGGLQMPESPHTEPMDDGDIPPEAIN